MTHTVWTDSQPLQMDSAKIASPRQTPDVLYSACKIPHDDKENLMPRSICLHQFLHAFHSKNHTMLARLVVEIKASPEHRHQIVLDLKKRGKHMSKMQIATAK